MQKLHLTTDQNVPIEIELAEIGQRILAVFIDVIILGIYFIVVTFIITFLFERKYDLFTPESYDIFFFLFVVLVFLPVMLYTPLMEFFTKGQTVGKIALGLRVTKINGENAKFKDYFTRWLFRPYEFYLIIFVFGGALLLITSFFFDTLISSISSKNQRIGDFMANTVVVRQKSNKRHSINDVLAIQSNRNYSPTYSGITMYTDEDMILVKRVISRVEKLKNKSSKAIAIQLADKIAKDLGLEEFPPKKLRFLKTILRDYVVLTR